MGQHCLPGNPPIAILLRRSARARRISLRVSSLDGRVTLTLPRGVSDAEALDFAREKEHWLRGHVQAVPDLVQARPGAQILIEGQLVPIREGPQARVAWVDGAIVVPSASKTPSRKLKTWLQGLARDRLAGASDEYARALGRQYSALSLRDTRSRWGSCSSEGRLMYSWRLIMAPGPVLRYVAAHEVAHLQEMSHSDTFWRIVTQLYGPHEDERRWLRENGPTLHRVAFDD